MATPLYTDTNGMGRVKYPKADSASMYFVTMKDGWKRAAEDPWVRLAREQDKVGTNQIIVTIRMLRVAADIPGSLTQGGDGTGKSGSAATGSADIPGNATTSVTAPDFRPHPVLVIHFPVGSNVRVEATDNLGAKVWDSVTTITNLPASPNPYICGEDCSTATQRFYRAVVVP